MLGTDLPSAATQIAEAFTGGFNAVAALDDKLGFLTASERAHIKDLFDSGQAEAARAAALDAYTSKADAAAAKQRAPWSEAAHSLGNAWDALLKYIATSAPIQITIAALDHLANAVKKVGDAIAGARGSDAPQPTAVSRLQGQIAALKKDIAEYDKAIAGGSPISGTLQRLVGRRNSSSRPRRRCGPRRTHRPIR